MERKKRKGYITKLTDVNNIDLKNSMNLLDFGDGGTQRKDYKDKDSLDSIELCMRAQEKQSDDKDFNKLGQKYIDNQEDKKDTMPKIIINKEKEKFNKKTENGMQHSVMVFSSKDKEFEQQMIAKIEEQKNKKIKPTKMKFKKPQALNQSMMTFGNYSSINSQTYGTNNLSQSMMIFTNKNNNKAEKGTDKTKKIDFKKGK